MVGCGACVRVIGSAMWLNNREALEEGTPDEIAAAMERVLARDWDRRGLRQAAIATFGLGSAVDRYLALISRLSQGAPAQRG